MSTTTKSGLAFAAIGVAAAAMAISIAAWFQQPALEEEVPTPQTREFHLLTQVEEAVDEGEFGIPPDLFFPAQIAVNKGDRL